MMAVLLIRDLPDDVLQRLGVRAAGHGRSMEAEAGALLTAAVEADHRITPEALQAWVAGLYGGSVPRSASSDLIVERRDDESQA